MKLRNRVLLGLLPTLALAIILMNQSEAIWKPRSVIEAVVVVLPRLPSGNRPCFFEVSTIR